MLKRAFGFLTAHPHRAIIAVTLLVIAAVVGGSVLESRELDRRLTAAVFRTDALTAYSAASHLKGYLDSRGKALIRLTNALTADIGTTKRISDIENFYRFADREHVAAVLLLSGKGRVVYSTDKALGGEDYSKTRFWDYVEKNAARYSRSKQTLKHRRVSLSTPPPYAGTAGIPNRILVGLPLLTHSKNGIRPDGAVALLIRQFTVIPSPIEIVNGLRDTTSEIGIGVFTASGFPFIHLWSNVPRWNVESVAKVQAGGRETCTSCHQESDIGSILGGSSQRGTSFVTANSLGSVKGRFLWTSARLRSSVLDLQDGAWNVVVSVNRSPAQASINSYLKGSLALMIVTIVLLAVIISLGFYAQRRNVLEEQRSEYLEHVAKVRGQYEVLIEKSNDGIYILFENRFVFVNKRFEELTGYTIQELAEVDFMQLVAPKSRPLIEERIKMIDRGEELEPRYSFEALSKDGRSIPIEVSVTHVKDEGKVRTIGIVRDLSELTAQKRLYEDLFNHAPIGLAIYKDFRAVKVNNAASELLGYDRPDELIGAHVLQFIHPDDLPTVRERVKKAMESRFPAAPYEEKFLKKDGGAFHALVLSQPVIYDGDDAVQVAFVSLEDRKKLEESLQREAAFQELEKIRLDTLLQRLNEGILFQGADSAIEFANAEFCRIVGIDNCADIIGKRTGDILSITARLTEDPEGISQQILKDIQQRKAIEAKRLEFDNGSIIEVSALPIYDSTNNYIGRLTIFRDVTTRERNAEAIKKLQRTELLGRLAGGIAHDFNNVLGIIIGSLQMALRKSDSQASVRDNAQRALSSALRGSEISKRLLQFVRYSPQGFEVFSLRQIVEETASIVRHTFEENIAVHTEFAVRDAHIYGSPGDMQQVLINLANNARDAMVHGGTFTFSLSGVEPQVIERRIRRRSSDEYVLLMVHDTGQGIEADKLDKIFDPFFTTKDIGKGTGLGLSIVQTIISAHGGFIDVESQPGQGTTFFIYLPTAEDKSLEQETAKRQEAGEAKELEDKVTVLVVEDEDGLRELLYEFLSEMDFNVITANDGQDGLRMFNNHPEISVVLSDLGLPKLAGDEMLAKIKAERPEVKCILATGYLTPNADGNLGHLNVKTIMKPYNLTAVYDVLVETLAR